MDMQPSYQLSQELYLILTAATLGCQHKNTNEADIQWQQIDWPKALKLANFHGLSCWLAEYIKDVPQVPDEIKKQLKQKQRRELLSHVFTEQKKCELMAALTQADIRFAILKGVAIARPLYQQRWYYRSIADLDILIDPMQLERAFTLLKKLGYCDDSENILEAADFEQIAAFHQSMAIIEHSLELPKRQLTLDIHWKLRRNALLPIKYDELFGSILLDSSKTPRLNQHLELIHLCVNGMNDGWRKLKALVDILYYAQNISDWVTINAKAQQLELLHVVNASLALCDYFFKTSYAPEKLSRKERTLLSIVINGFIKDDECPCLHSYVDRSNVYRFIKTTLSWWLSIKSGLVSKRVVIMDLLTPGIEDVEKGIFVKKGQFFHYFVKRMTRIFRNHYLVKK
jgi:hypothetical protein